MYFNCLYWCLWISMIEPTEVIHNFFTSIRRFISTHNTGFSILVRFLFWSHCLFSIYTTPGFVNKHILYISYAVWEHELVNLVLVTKALESKALEMRYALNKAYLGNLGEHNSSETNKSKSKFTPRRRDIKIITQIFFGV